MSSPDQAMILLSQRGGLARVQPAGAAEFSNWSAMVWSSCPRNNEEWLCQTGALARSERRGDIAMGVRILVVEDENEIADFLMRGLREEGFSVERAADGEEGWHFLKTGTWDVVLLDWWLPATDG